MKINLMNVVAGLILTIATTTVAIAKEDCKPDECIYPFKDYRAADKSPLYCLHTDGVAINKIRLNNIKKCLADFESRAQKGEYYLCHYAGEKGSSDKQTIAEIINSFYGEILTCEERIAKKP